MGKRETGDSIRFRNHLTIAGPTFRPTQFPPRKQPRCLFASGGQSETQPEVLRYLETISQQQKQCIEYHKLTLDRLDALISVLSGPAESIPTPIAEIPIEPVTPAFTPPVVPGQATSLTEDDTVIFQLRSKASSIGNFAVKLLRKYFDPSELDGRNVRGVAGKLPLNPEKINEIRDLVFKYYPTAVSQQEILWRDCRKAIDSYLRNRKSDTRI